MSMRRSRLEQTLSVMLACQKPITKNHIIQQSGVHYLTVGEILDKLLSVEIIRKVYEIKKSMKSIIVTKRSCYILTGRGLNVLCETLHLVEVLTGDKQCK